MIFDATYSVVSGHVFFKCALEDYDTEPVYEADVTMEETTVLEVDCEPVPSRITVITWSQPLAQVPRWATRLLSILMPKIEEMLLTGKPQELRRWMDDQLLEQIEKE